MSKYALLQFENFPELFRNVVKVGELLCLPATDLKMLE